MHGEVGRESGGARKGLKMTTITENSAIHCQYKPIGEPGSQNRVGTRKKETPVQRTRQVYHPGSGVRGMSESELLEHQLTQAWCDVGSLEGHVYRRRNVAKKRTGV